MDQRGAKQDQNIRIELDGVALESSNLCPFRNWTKQVAELSQVDPVRDILEPYIDLVTNLARTADDEV